MTIFDLLQSCRGGEVECCTKLTARNNEWRLGNEQQSPGYEQRCDLPEQPGGIRYFVYYENRECCIDAPIPPGREPEGIGSAAVQNDPRHQPFGFQPFLEEVEHLFLEVGSNDGPLIACRFRELPREKARAAPKIEYMVTRFHVAGCNTIGTIQKPSETGVQVPGSGRREYLVGMRVP